MNPEVKSKWLEALRSGKYIQTKTALKRGNGYCCLGVLCDVVEPDMWKGDTHRDVTSLPDLDLREHVGLDYEDATKLSEMNDTGGKSFSEIADYIEANL